MQPILAPGKSIYNEGVKIIAPYTVGGSERQYVSNAYLLIVLELSL